MGSATGGIVSLLIVLQAETQAGTAMSVQPSQRLRSMSVASRPTSPACTFSGHARPDAANTPADVFRKDLRLIPGMLFDFFIIVLLYARSMYLVRAA